MDRARPSGAVAVMAVMAVMALASVAAATTPPAGFVLQETITLNTALTTEGVSQSSTTTLQTGITYKIRISGTFVISDATCPFADAEFGLFDAAGADSCATLVNSAGGVDLGIAVNDAVVDASKFPNWGAYRTNHEYTIDYAGLGAPVSFTYHDSFYPDNSGTLTAEIFVPAQSVPTLTEWARILLVGLLVGSGLWLLHRRRRLA